MIRTMPPREKTLNSQPETLSDRDFLMQLAKQTENCYTELSARLDQQLKQLDHLDTMLHEIHQFITEHRPALAKALALLDPGNGVRQYLRNRKNPKGATDGG